MGLMLSVQYAQYMNSKAFLLRQMDVNFNAMLADLMCQCSGGKKHTCSRRQVEFITKMDIILGI